MVSLSCAFLILHSENDDSHILQDISPVYLHLCSNMYCLKMMLYKPHKNIVFHQCLCIYIFKDELLANDTPQTWQEYSYSPVCVRMCVFKDVPCENDEPHTLHA